MHEKEPSPISLANLLETINVLKNEVASLTTRLQAVEGRLSIVEITTSAPKSASGDWRDPDEVPLEAITIPQTAPIELGGLPSASSTAPKLDPADHICSDAIKTHLQPVMEGISALAAQLSTMDARLDSAIRVTDTQKEKQSAHLPPTTPKSQAEHQHRPASIQPDPAMPHPQGCFQSEQLHILPESVSSGRHSTPISSIAPPQPALIFGKPSTPIAHRPPVNLQASDSPFAKYGDKTSPFAKLAQSMGPGVGSSGLFAGPSTPVINSPFQSSVDKASLFGQAFKPVVTERTGLFGQSFKSAATEKPSLFGQPSKQETQRPVPFGASSNSRSLFTTLPTEHFSYPSPIQWKTDAEVEKLTEIKPSDNAGLIVLSKYDPAVPVGSRPRNRSRESIETKPRGRGENSNTDGYSNSHAN